MRQQPSLIFLILVACPTNCVREKTGQSDEKHRPNVVLILTDDQGWGDLSMHGNKKREFFCYVPFNALHGPFQVPGRYFDKYKETGFNDMEGHGWAHDWLVNWVNGTDSVFWEVAVEESMKYKLDLLYCCAEENLGSELSVRCGGQTSDSEITMAYDPEYIPSPGRVKRIEVYEKKWAKLSLGELLIPGGSQQIVLKVKSIPNKMVGEIKGLVLTKTI